MTILSDNMEALLYFSTSVYVLYTLVTLFKFGITSSISESHYKWKELEVFKTKHFTPFYLFCTFTGLPMMIYLIDTLPEMWKFLGFLCGSGLLFTGNSSYFKSFTEHKVHLTSAILSAISSIAIILIYKMMIIIPILLCIFVLIYYMFNLKKDNLMYLGEHLLFIGLFITLLLK